MKRRLADLRRAQSGATALEFGLVASLFIPLCLAIIGAGLLMWTRGALQSVAAQTARCAAIEAANCPDIADYAVSAAATWTFPGVINADDVQQSVVCRFAVPFVMVTITSRFWAGSALPGPFSGITLSSVAYFPTTAPSCS
jgi:Flp pilus assembly protein TadG